MPRPNPLSNLTSARSLPSDNQILTPRTPHSRAGRAEEGYTEIELGSIQDAEEEDDDDEHRYRQQEQPLLRSDLPPGYRSRGDDFDAGNVKGSLVDWNAKMVMSRLPAALAAMAAGLLLFLIILSYERPGTLERYVGVAVPSINATASAAAAVPTQASSATNSSSATEHSIMQPTISYEKYTTFPLLPDQYLIECGKLTKNGFMSHGDYWDSMPGMETLDVMHHDEAEEAPGSFEGEATRTCTSTITYMLDGRVGLFADLALIAQAAALARERNRTFLIDDTYWDRGKFTDYFQDVRARQPGPEPGCRAPPPEELVACPRLARHWVINSRTAKYHFGHAFSNHYENPYAHSINRLKPMYTFAQESLEDTIRPNTEMASLISDTRETLPPQYIAVHLRRGDKKPESFSHHQKYVPISEFTDAVNEAWDRLNLSSSSATPSVYLASDALLEGVQEELSPEWTVYTIEKKVLMSPKAYNQTEFDRLGREERALATKGVIVDFAVISGAWAWEGDVLPEALVCTMSSAICKLAAVGFGWTRAFGEVDKMGNIDERGMRWIDLDGKRHIVPLWKPFDLF